MITERLPRGEYHPRRVEWADPWAVVSDGATFAAKFNAAFPGAHRRVTADDVRLLQRCGLIGRRGFFERSDLETIRGVLLYEWLRVRAALKGAQHRAEQSAPADAEAVCSR